MHTMHTMHLHMQVHVHMHIMHVYSGWRGGACSKPILSQQARRVARRRVVVMDQSGGCELERLGLTVVKVGRLATNPNPNQGGPPYH